MISTILKYYDIIKAHWFNKTKSALAQWSQIYLFIFQILSLPFHPTLLKLIHPWELTPSIPWVSAVLVPMLRWEVSVEGCPVSPGSAARVSTPCAWEKVFCL